MPSRKTPWLEAALIFGISRLVILFLTAIANLRLPLLGQTATRDCALDSTPCLLSWFHWDAIAYVNVANHAYSLTRDTVFFPLWPLLIHWVGALFGASTTGYYIAGLLLEMLEQRPIPGIGFAMDGLDTRRVIDVRYSGNIAARDVQLFDAE